MTDAKKSARFLTARLFPSLSASRLRLIKGVKQNRRNPFGLRLFI
jgi:hypothetical protein